MNAISALQFIFTIGCDRIVFDGAFFTILNINAKIGIIQDVIAGRNLITVVNHDRS
ncbi:hypothetical protein D3C85_1860110 [compost metagenome]